jgi:PAS domain S-box-containing protein
MAVATALNFVMIATALLLNRLSSKGAAVVAAVQAVLVMLSSYIAILGYVYNVSALYTVVPFSSVALHTALLFVMLGAGFMLKESRAGLMQLVASPYSGGRAARRLLPYILLVPPALGWLGLKGERLGLFGVEFAVAVVVVANIVTFTAVIISIVETLDDADGVRQQEIKFRSLLESAPDAMVIVDRKGRIALVNAQTEQLFGYQRSELMGQPVEQLMPLGYRHRHTGHVADFMAAPGTRAMGSDRKLFGLRKDGTEIPIEVSLAPVLAGKDILISSAIRDVTERRQAEKVLRELSAQNDMLLREMHHRVANSLQMIASILSLKARSVNSEEARLHLQNAHKRVLAVAAIQDHLHNMGQTGSVQIGPYLSKLCDSLMSSIIDDRPITLSVEAGEGETNSSRAVSLGLIVTELVINAIKYAFPGEGQIGHVVVGYEENGLDWRLIVSDNGVWQSESERLSVGKGGLGASLVKALAQQLGAEVEIISGRGGMSVSVGRQSLGVAPSLGMVA